MVMMMTSMIMMIELYIGIPITYLLVLVRFSPIVELEPSEKTTSSVFNAKQIHKQNFYLKNLYSSSAKSHAYDFRSIIFSFTRNFPSQILLFIGHTFLIFPFYTYIVVVCGRLDHPLYLYIAKNL
jgi:hypothetical protein